MDSASAAEPLPDSISLEQTAAFLEDQGGIVGHAERYGGNWQNCPFIAPMGEAGLKLVEQLEQRQQNPQEKTIAELLAERRQTKVEIATDTITSIETQTTTVNVPLKEETTEAIPPQLFEEIPPVDANPPVEVILAEQETILHISHEPVEVITLVGNEEDTTLAIKTQVVPTVVSDAIKPTTSEALVVDNNTLPVMPVVEAKVEEASFTFPEAKVAELFIAPTIAQKKETDFALNEVSEVTNEPLPVPTGDSTSLVVETFDEPAETGLEALKRSQNIETWVDQLLTEVAQPTPPEVPGILDIAPIPTLAPELKNKVVETVEIIATCLQTIAAESPAPEQLQVVTEQLESLVRQLFEDLEFDTSQEVIKVIVQDMITATQVEWLHNAQVLIASPVDSNGTHERKLPSMQSLQTRLGQAFRQRLERLTELSRYIMNWLTPEAAWVARQLRAAS